ncbi:hypothetical protein [Bradyrhizobium sp. BR 1432]|uniref:hypothetical protein n=1 Tax=Bradyrhizobium sp. BR 1432 TaxID=3447966 RepID=UPI003EE6BF37
MASFADLFNSTRGHLQALVEFTIAGFNQGLLQVTLGKVAGEIVRGKSAAKVRASPTAALQSSSVGSSEAGATSAAAAVPQLAPMTRHSAQTLIRKQEWHISQSKVPAGKL